MSWARPKLFRMNTLGLLLPLFSFGGHHHDDALDISIVTVGKHLCVGYGGVVNNLYYSQKLSIAGLCHLSGGLCLIRLLLHRVAHLASPPVVHLGHFEQKEAASEG